MNSHDLFGVSKIFVRLKAKELREIFSQPVSSSSLALFLCSMLFILPLSISAVIPFFLMILFNWFEWYPFTSLLSYIISYDYYLFLSFALCVTLFIMFLIWMFCIIPFYLWIRMNWDMAKRIYKESTS